MQKVTDPDLLAQLNGTAQQAPSGPVVIPNQAGIDSARNDQTRTDLAVEGNSRDAERFGNDTRNQNFNQLRSISDAYNKDPTVAAYRERLPFLRSALKTAENPFGDNTLTTLYVKTLDDGVVNEGERAGVADAQGALASQIEKAKRDFGLDEKTGMYTPESRARIRREIFTNMGGRVKGYNQRRAYYQAQAEAFGIDPKLVIGNHDADPFVGEIREYDRANKLGEYAPGRDGAIPGQGGGQNPFQGVDPSQITFDMDTGTGAFGSEIEGKRLSPEQQAEYAQFIKAMGQNLTPESLNAWWQSKGFGGLSNAADVVKAAKDGTLDLTVNYSSVDAEKKRIAMEESYKEIPQGGDVSAAGRDKGLLLNMTDELRGGIGGIKSLLSGDGFTSGYERERNIERALQERSRQENGIAPELIGGLMTPAGVISRTNMARDAAAMGAIAGFGEGEGLSDSVAKTATGAGLGYLGGKAVEKIAPAIANSAIGQKAKDIFTRTPNADAQEFAAAAERQGLDYLPADVPGATKTRFATSIAKATLGGIPLSEAAQKIGEKARAARDRIAGNVGQVAPDAAGAGQAARRGMEAWERQTDGRGGQLFEAIPIPPQTEVSAENTRAALAEITRGMESNPELSRLWTENPRMKATLDALTPKDVASEGAQELAAAEQRLAAAQEDVRAAQARVASAEDNQRTLLQGSGSQWGASGAEVSAARREFEAAKAAVADATTRADKEMAAVSAATSKSASPPVGGKISWEDMRRLRSIVGQISGKPSLSSDGAADAAMRKFYGALTQDIEQAAAAHSPEAAKAFSRANNYWRGRQDRIDNVMVSLLGQKGEASAESTFQQLERWSSHKGGDFSKLARAIRSMPPEEANTVRATIIDRLGDANPGAQGAANDNFSADTFLTQWSKLGDRAKAVLFQGEHRKALDDLATVFEGTKFSRGFDNNSRTGLINSSIATLGATMAEPISGITLGVTQLAGGKLLSSPRFARWLVALSKKPNPSAQLAHINQLTAIARAEPIIANDIFTLQQRLSEAFAQPQSLRAAAKEDDEVRNPEVREGERNGPQ
ncbi:hypothetical protein L7H23_01245 [Sphingopyxis sp. BSN-002]|uniref:hypothetical protein n=1 Tax=Sphingopyxis sp. BSN-002 TaxID=2911495 RepID=UPI001EDA5CCC|nr:hypothetical protein [Sphingopyxis sp. BSN-002]QVJ07696.1 hypothetical protein [Sphingopyxis phage VSN-002]UKK84758.1 hypothetical protein L7H23_01245 [Sphingopyxis sp. BSN-002]